MLSGALLSFALVLGLPSDSAVTAGPSLPALAATSPYVDAPLPAQIVQLSALSVMLGLSEGLVKPSMVGQLTCSTANGMGCDEGALHPLDRATVHASSAGWRLTSDIAQISAVALPAALTLLDYHFVAKGSAPWQSAGRDTLVILNSTLLATSITQTLKWVVGRPRPSRYQPGSNVGSVDQQSSFPSGHVTAAAAAAVAYATTFALRRPSSRWKYLVYGGVLTVVGLTAAGRVWGGRHFPSDVLGGAVVGAATGFLYPYALYRF